MLNLNVRFACCIFVLSNARRTGLGVAAAGGRAHGVPVLQDAHGEGMHARTRGGRNHRGGGGTINGGGIDAATGLQPEAPLLRQAPQQEEEEPPERLALPSKAGSAKQPPGATWRPGEPTARGRAAGCWHDVRPTPIVGALERGMETPRRGDGGGSKNPRRTLNLDDPTGDHGGRCLTATSRHRGTVPQRSVAGMPRREMGTPNPHDP